MCSPGKGSVEVSAKIGSTSPLPGRAGVMRPLMESTTLSGDTAHTLLALLADGGRTSALSFLHERAVHAVGGTAALLFERNPRNGSLQATSGYGLDRLPSGSLHLSPSERRFLSQAYLKGAAFEVPQLEKRMPALHAKIGTTAAVLVALVNRRERVGLLAIGLPARNKEAPGRLERSGVPAGFVLALEIARLRQREEMERDIRTLLDTFSERVTATLDPLQALDPLCSGAARLFAADHMAVWLHDRESRQLVLKASSDPAHLAEEQVVRADDPVAPAAAALRAVRAGISGEPDQATCTLTVPLRGCRRALGTIVLEGVRVEAGDEINLLDRADELGRQLSSAIEAVQLLDVVTRSRRELEQVFGSIAHLVAVVDPRGRIVRVNPAFAAAAGEPAERLRQRPFTDCVGPELSGWLAELGDLLEQPVVRELHDAVLGGPYLVTVTDFMRDTGRAAGRVIVARDLLPLVAEREREELRGRLVQSEKLAALGQLVAGVAHELNNPLQGVLGHLELLRSTGAFPPKLKREIQRIYRDADRTAKIVRNLLVFAGSRRVQRRRVSLTGVLQKVLLRRRPSCSARGIEVVRHYQQQLPRVLADPLLLHQVFLNMMINAEDAAAAAPGGGRIEVSTRMLHRGRTLVASIRDNGPGLAPETITRVFEPFFTTKPVGAGTGLGLAIAYGIVQEHGGRITAQNHTDGGALFTVELPLGDQHD